MNTSQSIQNEIDVRLKELSRLNESASLLQQKVAQYSPLDKPIKVELEIGELEKRIQELKEEIDVLSSGKELKPIPRRKIVDIVRNSWFVSIALLTTILAVAAGLFSRWLLPRISENPSQEILANFALNFLAEFLGIILTIGFISFITRSMSNKREEREKELITEIKKSQRVIDSNKNAHRMNSDLNLNSIEERTK